MKKGNKYALFPQFLWRIVACHIVSYFVLGLICSTILNYQDIFTTTILSSFMRPISSPWVAAGPSLQIIRGILFAVILWPIKDVFLGRARGWLVLWGLFIGLAVLGPVGPSPGSLEGMIYTKLSIADHLFGLPEVVLQTLIFCLGLTYWYKRPAKVWNVLMAVSLGLILLMSIAGILFR